MRDLGFARREPLRRRVARRAGAFQALTGALAAHPGVAAAEDMRLDKLAKVTDRDFCGRPPGSAFH